VLPVIPREGVESMLKIAINMFLRKFGTSIVIPREGVERRSRLP